MAQINLLGKDISELIAAGEVIERPASVIKELVENSIDAGSEHITVEIKNGGTTYMRVTDDGCGIAPDQTATAFLRHATSKISSKDDLDSIMTLGFRGEALASVSAVAKVELLTKRAEDELGTDYVIEGSVEVRSESTGCPNGTTIMIRDIFYNVPVRRKFLKKDTAEANVITTVMQKTVLSHPEISFKFIKDNKVMFSSPGDGKLLSAIYSIYGRDFARDLVPVNYTENNITVTGYVVKPLYSKKNRSFQNFFVNGRSVRSVTCCVSLEEAYKNLVMTGKYPACVLMLEVPPDGVDVNIHPAKAEVRFSDEKIVFNSVFFAVKNALMASGLIYEFDFKEETHSEAYYKTKPFEPEQFSQPAIPQTVSQSADRDITLNENAPASTPSSHEEDPLQKISESAPVHSTGSVIESVSQSEYGVGKEKEEEMISFNSPVATYGAGVSVAEPKRAAHSSEVVVEYAEDDEPLTETAETAPEEEVIQSVSVDLEGFSYINAASFEKHEPAPEPEPVKEEVPENNVNVVGEMFKNYIVGEWNGSMIMIDKHAAHERVIFERLRKGCKTGDGQLLLTGRKILLTENESGALQDNIGFLTDMGFSLDFSQLPYVTVNRIPLVLQELEMDEVIPEIAENLALNKVDPQTHLLDDMLHDLACKAAIKANDRNTREELQALAEEVVGDENIRHCPHGRPVMFVLTKRELEKQFRRIV